MVKINRVMGKNCDAHGHKNIRVWHGFPHSCAQCIAETYVGDLRKQPMTSGSVKASHKVCSNGPHLKVFNIKDPKRCVVCNPNSRDTGIDTHPETRTSDWYIPDVPCFICATLAARHVDGRCQGCDSIDPAPTQTPRQIAIAAGDQWYQPETPCKTCRTYSLRRVSNGVCQRCNPPVRKSETPRSLAVAAGEKWFMPEEPCTKCHVLAPKRVNNSSCKACAKLNGTDREIMHVMALTRENALLWGYGVYHDGTHWKLI